MRMVVSLVLQPQGKPTFWGIRRPPREMHMVEKSVRLLQDKLIFSAIQRPRIGIPMVVQRGQQRRGKPISSVIQLPHIGILMVEAQEPPLPGRLTSLVIQRPLIEIPMVVQRDLLRLDRGTYLATRQHSKGVQIRITPSGLGRLIKESITLTFVSVFLFSSGGIGCGRRSIRSTCVLR